MASSEVSTMRFVPLEIVREIVQHVYAAASPPVISRLQSLDDMGVSTKPSWSALDALSAASKAYREIGLEVWFRTLRIGLSSELEVGVKLFPALSRWTRCVHSTHFDPQMP